MPERDQAEWVFFAVAADWTVPCPACGVPEHVGCFSAGMGGTQVTHVHVERRRARQGESDV